jgi:hypothetical protein
MLTNAQIKRRNTATRPWHVCKQSNKGERMGKKIPVKSQIFKNANRWGKKTPPKKKSSARE